MDSDIQILLHFGEKDLTYESESVYNYLQVSEDDREVILSTNVLFGVQSVYMKQDRLTGMYYDYAMAAPLMVEDKDISDMDIADSWNGYRNLCNTVQKNILVI